jgi:GAF domain-containing protein
MIEQTNDQELGRRLEQKERQLEAARRISQALFQHINVDELVEQALTIALEVVNAQAGSVLLAKPETKELVFYHAVGEKAPPMGTAFPWSQGIAGSVFQSGEAIVAGDVKQDSRDCPTIKTLGRRSNWGPGNNE